MHPVLDLKYLMNADVEQKERSSDISSIVLSVQVRWSLISTAQRKIPVVLSFPYHRHKACIANDQQTVQCTFSAVDSDLRFQIRKQAFQSVIQGNVLPFWCATAECSRNPHGNDMQSSLKRHAIHTEMYDVEESIDI